MTPLHDADDRAALAGEYVLGTLSASDHAAFVAALVDDRAALAAVYAWQDHLLGLTLQAAPATPPPGLWPRIEASLPAPATSGAAPQRAASATPWWQRLPLWQGLSGAALAACLVLGVLLQQRLAADTDTGTGTGTHYVAVLQSPDQQRTGWVVDLRGKRLRLVPTAAATAPPPGRSLQFWTKPDGAAGPTSLGLVVAGQTLELPLSRLPAVGAQQLFEVTLEPEGGSTIGRPTGPILFVGRSVAL